MTLVMRSLLSKPLCNLCHSQARLFATKTPFLLSKAVKPSLVSTVKRLVGSAVQVTLPNKHKAVGVWLMGVSGMIFVQVSLGGITRLTESGLSMVDWHLIKGMRPPSTEAEWQAEFDKYKTFPEYKFKVTEREMSLSEFKFIWSMEYLHRMWGRSIGLAFLLPAAAFWLRGRFDRGMKVRVVGMGTLLVAQGLYGWYMVKSGLDPKQNSNADIPRVSQYRLAGHLTMAVGLYTLTLWNGLTHLLKPFDHSMVAGAGRLRMLGHMTKTSIFLTIVSGAFVAGLDAGLVYNSWPMYADRWIPSDLLAKSPTWKNFTENPTTVQFDHRNLGYLSLALMTGTWLAGRRLAISPRARIALNTLVILGYAQVTLGVATLVHFVPVWLAALHQTNSMAVLSAAFWLTNELRKVPK